MKILVVHNFFQSFGGEDAIFLAEKELLEKEPDIYDVLTYERHNDEIKSFNLGQKVRFARDTIYSPRTVRDVSRIVDTHQPDIAYIHNIFPLISPSIYSALQARKIPTVQVMHDLRLMCPNGWMYRGGHVCEKCKSGNMVHCIFHRCYRHSYALSTLYAISIYLARRRIQGGQIDGFVCMTEFLAKHLRDIGIREDRIIIKPHAFEAPAPLSPPADHGYVLYLGRLSSEKGVHTLLKAFESLPGIPLRIAGTGPLESFVRRCISGRPSNISWVGFLRKEEKHAQLAGARCVVVPSEWYEAFGMVVLEAYSAGKPVIASRIGSLPEIVRDTETGVLCQPGDAPALAEAVQSLFSDPELCREMGERGRRLLAAEYSPERNLERLDRLFASLISSKDRCQRTST